MKWLGRERSGNVDDRRGMSRPAAGLGIGGIIVVVIYMFLGGDSAELANILQQQQTNNAPNTAIDPNDEDAVFVSVVLKDTEDVWEKIFREQFGREYRKPTLVLFDGAVESGQEQTRLRSP